MHQLLFTLTEHKTPPRYTYCERRTEIKVCCILAFDTVRHSSVMAKVAQLDLPDSAYNCLTNHLYGHSHCTKYNGHTSDMHEVNASIIQGSGVGPALYVLNAADLHAVKACKSCEVH